jgi:glucuronate isomerase
LQKSQLNPYRFFDADPIIRKIAIELYQEVKDLPIISPHGHVDPKILAENLPFPDPTELILIPDHYVFRMLYSQGISMESLGISTKDGTEVESDHRKIWQIFADHYYLFDATPTGAWLSHEFAEVFGIQDKLNGDNAMKIYDELQEKLQSTDFSPRTLYDRFNIEVLSTTDAAADSLEYHKQIISSDWNGKVIPCFRPDKVVNIDLAGWREAINELSEASDIEIDSYKSFIHAIEKQREYFKEVGATSTDQGILSPYTHQLDENDSESIFSLALKGKATFEDAQLFTAHMLMEMARMSIDDGLVMQIHPGSFRNHNEYIYKRFGPDKGCDIPIQTEYTRNLHQLLNKFGNDQRLSLIIFTLDETAYSRELAPMAGHYPAMKLGPAWWFHDSIEGMTRFREQVTETAGIYNTVGFNDDTRAFPSIPARHDLSRRVDANFLAKKVSQHIIGMDDARRMIRALAYDLAKKAYKL